MPCGILIFTTEIFSILLEEPFAYLVNASEEEKVNVGRADKYISLISAFTLSSSLHGVYKVSK